MLMVQKISQLQDKQISKMELKVAKTELILMIKRIDEAERIDLSGAKKKMILQRCLSSYLKHKHKNINRIFWAAPRVSETKEKRRFWEARCCAAPFSPLSVHICMLRQEDRSFPGKLLLSVLEVERCGGGGGGLKLAEGRGIGRLNPGCIRNHVMKHRSEDICTWRGGKRGEWVTSAWFFSRYISRSLFFQRSDPEHPEILFWATWVPNSWPPPRPPARRSPGRCYTTELMWSTAKPGHMTPRQIRITLNVFNRNRID